MGNENNTLKRSQTHTSELSEQGELNSNDLDEVFDETVVIPGVRDKPKPFYVGYHNARDDLINLPALRQFYATHTTRAHLVTPSISPEKLKQKLQEIERELEAMQMRPLIKK